jgi:tRNA modification GTPase
MTGMSEQAATLPAATPPAATPQDDLIVARATAAGPGAVAIVRVDGAGVRDLVERAFEPARKPHGPLMSPRRLVLGHWRAPDGESIDTGMTVFFPAPHSYTGNDLAEFHCHGGPVPVRRLIETAVSLGARPADPGEFTRRAFLNGRMDLSQAEAVADLINAQTDAAARAARDQLHGALTVSIESSREVLLELAAEIEARIDFPDEEIAAEDRNRLAAMFSAPLDAIDNLLATRRRGRLLREGARAALVGRPNAGKSSLLNALARMERAIVTPHPGTTRDTIECTIDLHGVPLVLVDTAGLRPSDDPVESIGIDRARREIDRADLVVQVIDATDAVAASDDPSLIHRPPDIVVWNKCDLLAGEAIPPPPAEPTNALLISATRGDGLPALEAALHTRLLGDDAPEAKDHLAIGVRHAELLDRARRALQSAARAFGDGQSGEFVMVDLRESLDALSEILGARLGDAILDRIFSRFCIGK